MRDMDLVELAPGMRPARDFVDRSSFVQVVEAGVSVGLERALVELEVLACPLALADESANQTAGAVVPPEGRSSRT